MYNKPQEPVPISPNSFYNMIPPKIRAYELPEIVSLEVSSILPDLPTPIYTYGDDVAIVREATAKALEKVDMSMIQPDQSVNIIASEHGFNIMGGFAYAELLKATRDVIIERTGCKHVRLRVAPGSMRPEGVFLLNRYGLLEHFEGKAASFTPMDEGEFLETEIGRIGVVKSGFDADWFVHTSYSDPREIYFNRNINRVYKAFAMGYAVRETRSAFHFNFGPRSSNILPQMIYNALSHKHAFTLDMDVSPSGVTGVSAENDIAKLNRAASFRIMKNYGALFQLASKIPDIIAIQDGQRWAWYNHCGGLVFGVMLKVHKDLFDLDIVPRNSEGVNNDKVKAIVVNTSTMGGWGRLALDHPVYLADQSTAMSQDSDLVSQIKMICNGLEDAVQHAIEDTGCKNLMVFDGNFGAMNLSPSLADFLVEKAPEAIAEAKALLPKWCRQRGIDPEEFKDLI